MSRPDLKALEVRRFAEGADQDAKREFASNLVATLDELQIAPGAMFLITSHEDVDHFETEVEDAMDERRELDAETVWKADRYDELVEALKDLPRGVRTLDEVLEAEGVR